MAVRILTVNRCGQGNDIIIPLQTNGGGGYYRMVSPNPATTTISVDLLGNLSFNTLKTMTLVSDARSTVVRSHDSSNAQRSDAKVTKENASFDVANLPRGTYYLVMVFGENKSFKETIVLR